MMLNPVGVHLFVWIYVIPGDSPRALMFNPFGVHSGPQRGPTSQPRVLPRGLYRPYPGFRPRRLFRPDTKMPRFVPKHVPGHFHA